MDNQAIPIDERHIDERIHILEMRIKELENILVIKNNEYETLNEQYEQAIRDLKKAKMELERLKSTPLIVGNIKDVIDDYRVVVKSSTGPDFIVTYSGEIDKKNLKNGMRVSLNKQTLAVMELLPSSIDSIVAGAEVIDKPSTTYDDIGGLDAQLREVRESVEYPLLYPNVYKKVGVEPPKGVLIIGPPGTGKTMIAKAIAHHTNACFIRFVGSELVQKYIGEGARLVRELFELANEKAPSIIFLDELDSIGSKRTDVSTSGDREVQRTLMQLLAELDGFEPLGNVKIIGATNRPDILDDALLRPGRFDRIIEIPKPDLNGRKKIFKIHTKNMSLAKDVDLSILADKSENATGAEIKAIITEAGMFTIREERDTVTMKDFLNGLDKVMKHTTKSDRQKQMYMFS
ncbi:MAG: proteasome-activating nucleotidase [Candidatus Thermoplasmatota archaeon]|nr:proteasome-activating nucleotidase [Candidatus Thermoplasmatota archaeon]MCL5963329.1 proteasome-activating nucleotidase [Candidatus Thermoplasmatota archaeon]